MMLGVNWISRWRDLVKSNSMSIPSWYFVCLLFLQLPVSSLYCSYSWQIITTYILTLHYYYHCSELTYYVILDHWKSFIGIFCWTISYSWMCVYFWDIISSELNIVYSICIWCSIWYGIWCSIWYGIPYKILKKPAIY